MPLPTTRRGRFLYRKAKYLQRRRRYYQEVRNRGSSSQVPRVDGARDAYPPRGKQQKGYSASTSFNATPAVPLGGDFAFATLSEVGNHEPPHVTVTDPTYLAQQVNGHSDRGTVKYHERAVNHWPARKPGRLSTFDRRCFCAVLFAKINGYFLDTDPLQRHPTFDDLMNGADPYPTFGQ